MHCSLVSWLAPARIADVSFLACALLVFSCHLLSHRQLLQSVKSVDFPTLIIFSLLLVHLSSYNNRLIYCTTHAVKVAADVFLPLFTTFTFAKLRHAIPL